MQSDDSFKADAEVQDAAHRAKLEQIVRQSIGQSLPAHFAPVEELPPRLLALLKRLDEI